MGKAKKKRERSKVEDSFPRDMRNGEELSLHSVSSRSSEPLKAGRVPREASYSVRLSGDERDLLVRAAELRGWSPTSLIRRATLEKATHVLNTSRLTKFNFRRLADQMADQLFTGRGRSGLPLALLNEIRRAARLGGGEFLNLIIESCDGLTANKRSDVPEPVDLDGKGLERD